MIINLGDEGGGIIVQSDEPVGDSSMMWVDTSQNGIAKYWDEIEEEWKPVAAVWT